MSARDELAKLLFITDNHSPDAEQDWLHLKPYGPKYLRGYYDGADAVLAAGYSKPRTITTEEELDALAPDCIVLDRYGVANQLSVERITEGPPERLWYTTGADCNSSVALPATVLYSPEASK